MTNPEVYRVEDRWNPDDVDFWDFLSQEEARSFKEQLESEDWDSKLTIRLLPPNELTETAIGFYLHSLKRT